MKLLVTTDFSANSKAAIRFAQSLAKQSKGAEVVFYYSQHFMKPTSWSNTFFNAYREEEINRLTAELKTFVLKTAGKEKGLFAKASYVIHSTDSTSQGIISYAEKNKVDYICIATQGAGMLRKIMGTHTAYIVNNSSVPAIIVPSHYRVKPLKKVVYLSDFENLKKETGLILPFTTALKLHTAVLHFKSVVEDDKLIETGKKHFSTSGFKNFTLNFEPYNLAVSLVERVATYVHKTKPELLIMFTNRKKGFFERIFLPGKTAELTYTTKVPVLVFAK